MSGRRADATSGAIQSAAMGMCGNEGAAKAVVCSHSGTRIGGGASQRTKHIGQYNDDSYEAHAARDTQQGG